MKIFFIGIGILILAALASIFLLPVPSGTRVSNDPNVVSLTGLHWHPQLTIYVKGEKVEIPHNIGLGAVHQLMHTHDDLPIIHLEFPARVTKDDLKLSRFFKIWDKDMGSFGTLTKMTVNGKENAELGDYVMRDGDKIELRYE